MKPFFSSMPLMEQTYWIISMVGSGIFIIIFALTFIGGGDADMTDDMTDFDADDGGVGFQFFTFKNVIAFFTVFGWTGLICLEQGYTNSITIIISTIAGLIMMVLTSLLLFWMANLAASRTLKIKNAIGEIGEVYLPIGAKRSSIGKIQIKVQGSLRELDAITDSEDILKTQEIVRVKEVISSEILLVVRPYPYFY
ncbi:MAG: hypothetical protein ACI8ZO_001128 [Flavobacteriales bacterium]|jgi:hypothetical protein